MQFTSGVRGQTGVGAISSDCPPHLSGQHTDSFCVWSISRKTKHCMFRTVPNLGLYALLAKQSVALPAMKSIFHLHFLSIHFLFLLLPSFAISWCLIALDSPSRYFAASTRNSYECLWLYNIILTTHPPHKLRIFGEYMIFVWLTTYIKSSTIMYTHVLKVSNELNRKR